MPFTALLSAGVTGWEVDYANRILRYASGARMTVQALYSGLMNEFDDSGNMDDPIPMSASTPTEFSLINGWCIAEGPINSYEYLSGGSIVTTGWNAAVFDGSDAQKTFGIYQLTMQAGGYTNAVAGDVGKTVTDGTRSGVLLAYNNTTRKWWVRRVTATAWAGACTITTGTGAGTITGAVLTGEDIWANFYTLGTYTTQVMYLYQNGLLVPSYAGYVNGLLDQLVKTRLAGTTIDSGNVTIFCRDLTFGFDNFTATASATGGRNPVPIAVNADANDTGGGATFSTVAVTFGTVSKNIGDGLGAVNYDVLVDGGGNTCAQVYERLKWILRRLAVNPGTFTTLTAGSGYFYRYANASYVENKLAPFALFAGGKIFGSRGIWLENVSDPNNRVVIDAAGVTHTPPTTITATITGVASSDRVLLAISTGASSTTVDKSQYLLSGSHSISGTTLLIQTTIPADTPTSGVIRVGNDRYSYASWAGSTFTLGAASPALNSAANVALIANYVNGDGAWVPLVDDTANATSIANKGSMTYVAQRHVVYRVRKYAAGAGNSILPFENSGQTPASASFSASVVRTVDSVAT